MGSMITFGNAGNNVPTSIAGQLVFIDAGYETITDASGFSCSVNKPLTLLDTTEGAQTVTMPDGLVEGQYKRVWMYVDGGAGANNSVMTITSPFSAGTNQVTFADVGDYVLMRWTFNGDGHWRILETGNDADGTSGPTVA